MKRLARRLFDKVLVIAGGIYIAWVMYLAVLVSDGIGLSAFLRCLFLFKCGMPVLP